MSPSFAQASFFLVHIAYPYLNALICFLKIDLFLYPALTPPFSFDLQTVLVCHQRIPQVTGDLKGLVT